VSPGVRFRRDDVIAALAQSEEYTLDGMVVCLGPTAGENDFLRCATEQRGD